MSIKELAVKNFVEKKYNCCQAVICAYYEAHGMNDEDVFKMTEGYGSGMGGLKDTCGAVTGMFLAMGMINSAGEKENPMKTKPATYKDMREAAAEFEKECGSIYCRDLKALVEGKQPVSCDKCVEIAAAYVEKYDENHK